MSTPEYATDEIRKYALLEGFDVVGFTSAEIDSDLGARLDDFLKAGFHGDMGWLSTHASRRKSPQGLWAETKSVIVFGANYGPDHLPHERLEDLRKRSRGNISVYARNQDYHDILKKRLKRIGRWMCTTFNCDVKVFVDTAPVLEKPLGAKAGLGWQGKHTNLVSREFGSWLFSARSIRRFNYLLTGNPVTDVAPAEIAWMFVPRTHSRAPTASTPADVFPTSLSNIRDILRRSSEPPWERDLRVR